MPVTIIADSPGGETITLTPEQIANAPVTIIVKDTLRGSLVVNGDAGNPTTPVTVRYPAGWTQSGPFIFTDDSPPQTITFLGNWIDSRLEVMCLVRGTLIDTPDGTRPIEELAAGDLALTRDNGARPIRWIGRRRLEARVLSQVPRLRPVRIRAGALGPGIPSRDLCVSPQHRMLVRSSIARRMFGCDEVLVAARQLLALDGIEVDESAGPVEYFHLLFDRHEIIFSNGAETESLYTGREALKSLSSDALVEVLSLFPGLAMPGAVPDTARPLPGGARARQLAARHLSNGRALVSPRDPAPVAGALAG